MITAIVALCGALGLAIYIIIVLVIALKHTAKELEEVSAELEPVIAGHTDTPTFRYLIPDNKHINDAFPEEYWD